MRINTPTVQPAISILRDLATLKPHEVKGAAKDIKKLNAGKV